jgi:hypothetical protein
MTEREPADLDRGGALRPIRRFSPLHRGCCCVVIAIAVVLAIPLGILYQRSVRSSLAADWTSWSWWRWRIALDFEREVLARDWLTHRPAHGRDVRAILDELGEPAWTTDHDEGWSDEQIGYVVGLGDDSYEKLQLELEIDAAGKVSSARFVSR